MALNIDAMRVGLEAIDHNLKYKTVFRNVGTSRCECGWVAVGSEQDNIAHHFMNILSGISEEDKLSYAIALLKENVLFQQYVQEILDL